MKCKLLFILKSSFYCCYIGFIFFSYIVGILQNHYLSVNMSHTAYIFCWKLLYHCGKNDVIFITNYQFLYTVIVRNMTQMQFFFTVSAFLRNILFLIKVCASFQTQNLALYTKEIRKYVNSARVKLIF